jgi:hypothetical protein
MFGVKALASIINIFNEYEKLVALQQLQVVCASHSFTK